MKKISSLIFYLLSFSNYLFYPQIVKQFEETSYALKDVCFINELTGWAVGNVHWDQEQKTYVSTIIKTIDGAVNWEIQQSPVNESLRSICFVDASNGWASGANGTILRTANGGDTWTKQSISTTDDIRSLKFVNADVGWVTTVKPVQYDDFFDEYTDWRASIWKTTNGGNSWIEQDVSDSAAILNDMDFIDPQNGWVVGIKFEKNDENTDSPEHVAVVYHTNDGGNSWREQIVPKPPAPAPFGDSSMIFTGVDFVNSQKGWVVGFKGNSAVDGGNIYYTSNGGETWIQDMSVETSSGNLWDIRFLDENRGYAVGTMYGAAWGPPVLRTLDGGQTWSMIMMEEHQGEGLYGIAVTENKVVTVGDYDFLSLSDNPWDVAGSEELFKQKYLNPHYQFEDIFFSNQRNGWAVGSAMVTPDSAAQVIVNTTDGGENWQIQLISDKGYPAGTPRLDKLSFVDTLTGWAVGGASFMFEKGNYILKTTDGGKHWISQDASIPSFQRELYSCHFLTKTNGWALEEGGSGDHLSLLHTLDGGNTWNRVETGIEGFWGVGFALVQGDIFFTDSLHGWAGGYNGGMISTSDGGASWTKQTYPDYGNCHGISFINNTNGWTTDDGGLVYTTNGGTLWSELNLYEILKGYAPMQDIHFTDLHNGWVAGSSGTILRTKDGGQNWENLQELVPTANDLLGIHFTNNNLGWATGTGGVILKIDASGLKKVQSITFDYLPYTVYGNEDFSPSATASSGLPVTYTSSNTDVASVTDTNIHIISVGSTNIIAHQEGNDEFYPAQQVSHELSVMKKNLIASAGFVYRNYGEANPVFELEYSGFAYEDDINAIDTIPTANCAATITSSPGNYDITVSGGSDTNYEIICSNGILIIQSTSQINEMNEPQIEVFPVPSNGNLTIQLPDNETAVIQLYNTKNGIVCSKEINNKSETMDLSAYPKGIYFIKITINNKSIVRKIVVN